MILFVHTDFATFVRADYEILRRHFPVLRFHYKAGKGLRVNLWAQATMSFWLLRNIGRAKCVYVWFADYHSLLPVLFARLLGRKSIVVVGGYDAAKVPELGYGAHVTNFRSFCVRTSCNLATLILPVSEFIKKEISGFCTAKNCTLIYNGADPALFQTTGGHRDGVLTVCAADDVRTVLRKGVDFFQEIAQAVPDQEFTVVGVTGKARQFLEKRKIPNLRIVGRLTQNELMTYYQKAKVYCQLSVYEAFGLALAEAMLCGCIPVGSTDAATPEVMGSVGFLIKSRDPVVAAETIRAALTCSESLSLIARQRILDHFSIQRRERALRELIGRVVRYNCGWCRSHSQVPDEREEAVTIWTRRRERDSTSTSP